MTDVPTPRIMRSTRFVLISETNGSCPRLPSGDVLCHARGLSREGDLIGLRRTIIWIENADFEVKIIIAGTSDHSLDNGRRRQVDLQRFDYCFWIKGFSPGIHYLHHEGRTIQLRAPTGPQTTFKIFASPYVPKYNGIGCAFGYERRSDVAESLWSQIPLDTDVLLTHTPAHNHRDTSTEWQAAGYEVLQEALWQVRPRLAVCGRIRGARGIEKVQWQLGQNDPPYQETQTSQIDDPGSRPLDTTSRSDDPLLNDWAPGQQLRVDHSEREQSEATSSGTIDDDSVSSSEALTPLTPLSGSSNMTAQTKVTQLNTANVVSQLQASQTEPPRSRLSDRDQAALRGRLGRQETLIVNASLRREGLLHQGRPLLREPIVVDIELPVGDEFAGRISEIYKDLTR